MNSVQTAMVAIMIILVIMIMKTQRLPVYRSDVGEHIQQIIVIFK